MSALAYDFGGVVATEVAERVSAGLVNAFERCADEDIPLTDTQKVQVTAAFVCALFGVDECVAQMLSADTAIRFCRGEDAA